MHGPVIGDEEHPSLRIERNSVRIRQPGAIALEQAKRRLLAARALAIDDNGAVVLNSEEYFLRHRPEIVGILRDVASR